VEACNLKVEEKCTGGGIKLKCGGNEKKSGGKRIGGGI
jgi:hypothetical protein